jgi:hypothetical protein
MKNILERLLQSLSQNSTTYDLGKALVQVPFTCSNNPMAHEWALQNDIHEFFGVFETTTYIIITPYGKVQCPQDCFTPYVAKNTYFLAAKPLSQKAYMATTMEGGSYKRITKLDSTNYQTWRVKMSLLLEDDDLFTVVNSNPPEETKENKTDLITWAEKSRKAFIKISLCVSDDQLLHIEDLSTGKEAWDALKTKHETASLSNKLLFLRQFFQTEMENTDMAEHIYSVQQASRRLNRIGCAIRDRKKCL